MSESFCFIINVSADKGKILANLEDNISLIKQAFPGSKFVYAQKGNSIIELAANAAKTYSVVVAVGGDGTVKQVANGIIGTETVLGVIPMGSGNDFAKSIGLDKEFESNIQILSARKTERIDIIETPQGIYLNTFGIGVDGLTSLYASQSKFKNGTFRYFFSGVKALVKSKTFSYKFTLDGEVKRGDSWMIVIANGSVEGGKYVISPESKNTDGKFEVIIVKNILRMRLLQEFLKLSFGFDFDDQVVLKSQGKQLHIQLEKAVFAHSDGEVVSPRKSFQFNLKKSAIPVITARN